MKCVCTWEAKITVKTRQKCGGLTCNGDIFIIVHCYIKTNY